jgi:predicted RNA-binding protein YlqC (UPF0109 family)
MPDPRDAAVSGLLYRMICAVVDMPQLVTIRTVPAEEGATFIIECDAKDAEKLAGSQADVGRSIRAITSAAGMKLGRRYVIETGRH